MRPPLPTKCVGRIPRTKPRTLTARCVGSCADLPSPYMEKHSKTCAAWKAYLSKSKSCESPQFAKGKYCQQSCSEIGHAYAGDDCSGACLQRATLRAEPRRCDDPAYTGPRTKRGQENVRPCTTPSNQIIHRRNPAFFETLRYIVLGLLVGRHSAGARFARGHVWLTHNACWQAQATAAPSSVVSPARVCAWASPSWIPNV